MLALTLSLKSITKKAIFILVAVISFTLLPQVAANAATVPTESAVSTGTTSAVTVPLTAAEKAAVKKAAAKAKKAAVAKKKAAIKAKKKAKAKRERAKVIKVAKQNRGVRYAYGGASPRSGFDCSGFTKYVFQKSVHMNLPHSANGQSFRGRKVSAKHAKPGDLVVYSYPGNANFHVSIYLTKSKVVSATEPGDVSRITHLIWGGSETVKYIDVIDPHVGL